MMKQKTVVFTGGGTGGHVYPALPIIKKLQDSGYRVCWIGSYNGIEQRIIREWGLEYYAISTGKLRRYFSLKNFTDLFRITAGLIQSVVLIRKIKPAMVFSKGGFVSVPPVIAAAILKIPSYTHDSDLDPGLATRINHKMTRRTFLAYEESRSYLGGNKDKIVVSGNPVRDEFYQSDAALPEDWASRIEGKPLLLVLGGSSGALQINSLVRECLGELCRRYIVVHQMGDDLFESETEITGYYPVPYLRDELPGLLQRACLAIARAGANTLWELAVTGTPGILIPLRVGSRGDQVRNAEIMRKNEMALVLEDDDPDAGQLLDAVLKISEDEELQHRMSSNCRNYMKKRAEDVIVDYLLREEC